MRSSDWSSDGCSSDLAKDHGYKFLLGGDADPSGTGYYVPITILDNPPEDARIVAEEQFGPVMPLMKFSSEEEVIARANQSASGLAGAVGTSNPDSSEERRVGDECVDAGRDEGS